MSKRKLLLADDSMTIQKVVNLTFADEGIEVFTVGNGNLAIERLSEIEPDLVLADVHMPGLNGYEVCEQIKTNPQFQNVPVILLVGSFEPFDEQEAQRVGANDFLTKPFQSIRQLVQKVTTLLDNQINEANGSSESESETQFVAPDTEISTQENSFVNHEEDFYVETPTVAQTEADSPSAEMNFSDPAFDDEMIETSSASDLDDEITVLTPTNQFDEQISGEELSFEATDQGQLEHTTSHENAFVEETPLEMRRTEPLSFNDIQDINSSMLNPPMTLEDQDEKPLFEFKSDIADEPIQEPVNTTQNLSSYDWEQNTSGANSNEEFDIELDLPASQEQVFEISGFDIVDNEETHPVEHFAPEGNLEFSPPVQTPVIDNEINEPMNLDLDEANLLQIDDEDSFVDLYNRDVLNNQSLSNTEMLPPMRTELTRQNFNESTNSALAQVGNQTISKMNLDFPPEVIEAIAQLVVEKLSDKVIEKIAWEIVPDRFDLIVRKQMDRRDR